MESHLQRGDPQDSAAGLLTDGILMSPSVSVQLLLSTFAINTLALALPVMTLQIYDRILPNKSIETFNVLVVGVMVALVFEIFLKLSRSWLLGWIGAVFEYQLAGQLMAHMLNTRLEALENEGTGAYVQYLAAIPRLKYFYNGELLVTLIEAFFVLVFLGLIAYIGGLLVLVPITVLALFSGYAYWHGRKLQGLLDERTEADNRRYNFLLQVLNGIHSVKAFSLEQVFKRRYERMEHGSTLSSLAVADASAGIFNTSTVVSHCMGVCVISVGALQVLHGSMTIGALVACVLLGGRMMQPVQRALQLWARYQDFEVTKRHIQNLFDLPVVQWATQAAAVPDETTAVLDIKGMAFGYPGSKPLLEDITMTLNAGDVVVINGREGTGKSTLLKLMAGIYTPTGGDLKVGGYAPVHLPARELVQRVGLLSGQGSIFRGTIRDNLTCFGEIDEKAAMAVADRLSIREDVARLPAGFDTHLEGIVTDAISPGLKQRIAIARVLAAQPALILFDNAEQALDQQGCEQLYALLQELTSHAAIVIVAEDEYFQQLAGKFLVLREGHLHADRFQQQRKEQADKGGVK